ncbi:sulfotransferase [uncultured Algibacter sp.]|uniref:sulfotransferase family protein n=1 Tax=uncultured Algibacter sp. TaxID=298659 RepID=UPI00260DA11A|nr:sulfotransferase [uncultured Algibacter sp.]
MKEEQLIFIVSQPRSGSTYLQNLLSNNEQTNTCSEPWLLLNFLNFIKPSLVYSKTDNELTIRALNNYLNKFPDLKYKELYKEFILKLYEPMFKDYEFAIDKTPRYWEILDELVELFPKSKIIVLHRNPINVAKSLIKTWNFSSMEDIKLFRRDLLFAPEKLHTFCQQQQNNSNVYSMYYEHLIDNTAFEVEKVYKWIGMDYKETVLDVSKNNKFKGEYGDPFQNSEHGYLKSRIQSQNRPLKKIFKNLLSGYTQYLGKEFLEQYEGYDITEFGCKRTREFKKFLNSREED